MMIIIIIIIMMMMIMIIIMMMTCSTLGALVLVHLQNNGVLALLH